jgi:hypothetical protein
MASAPTVFALMGIYRLAQRPVAKAAGFFWGSVRSVSSAVLGAASRLTQRLDASLASLVTGIAENLVNDDFGQQLVCGHSLRNVPCAPPVHAENYARGPPEAACMSTAHSQASRARV